jgi:ribosomal protein S18 acetylase RimI-like enzyme
MEIRLLTVDDTETFWKLRYEALRDAPEAFYWTADEFAARPMDDTVRMLRDATGASGCVLGAFDGDDLLGTTGCYRRTGAKLQHKAYVWGVYVAPRARRHGLARRLMVEALARARRWVGVEQVGLTVTASNESARDLYLSLGFRSYGVESRSLRIGDRYYDEDQMVLFL